MDTWMRENALNLSSVLPLHMAVLHGCVRENLPWIFSLRAASLPKDTHQMEGVSSESQAPAGDCSWTTWWRVAEWCPGHTETWLALPQRRPCPEAAHQTLAVLKGKTAASSAEGTLSVRDAQQASPHYCSLNTLIIHRHILINTNIAQ